MKVNVIIKGGRRWDYELRQRHNPSLAGTMGAGGGKQHHITMKGRRRLCLGRKKIHLQGKQREASWADCRGREREQKPQSHLWVKERNPRSRSHQALSAGSVRLRTKRAY